MEQKRKEEKEVENELKEVQDQEEKKKNKSESGFSWFKVAILQVLITLSILFGYHSYIVEKRMVRIKVFDLVGTLEVLRALYVQGEMSDKEVAGVMERMKEFLDREGKKGVIILPSQFVINKENIEEIKFQDEKLKAVFSKYEEKLKERMKMENLEKNSGK